MQFHMIAGGPKPVARFSHAVEAEGRLPARTCVRVTGLAYNALIEIDLIA
jgi:enamine deaminase RidA (YjgF/YER057c/UK114 family)